MRRFLPFAALLGVALVLGCQLRVTFAPQRDGRFALGLSVGF